jgi:hypothetical protein
MLVSACSTLFSCLDSAKAAVWCSSHLDVVAYARWYHLMAAGVLSRRRCHACWRGRVLLIRQVHRAMHLPSGTNERGILFGAAQCGHPTTRARLADTDAVIALRARACADLAGRPAALAESFASE